LNDPLTVSQDPFASSLAGRKLGRYEVLARLASGGMAGVYVARAIGVAGFERLFAIKVLHPHLAHEEEFISMFLDEARLAARIRHPNVVPTIDISDTPDAGFYLVMEYIEGDHLGALLQKAWKLGRRLPFPVTLRIVVDALEGLAAAHNLTDESGRRLQLVHRDVSPHNVMVSTDGVARITDFGVAKAEVRLSTTREGQFKGKLAYMAPEHASNGDADQRSDLFSMAIILWESLAGRRLFRAENHAATLNKICLEPIPSLSSVDPGLALFDPLLAKALARDPDDRFQSAEEFAEAVEEAAPMLGGLAKAREVAQLVREYAAEKVTRDADLIRSAIAQLTLAGGAIEPPTAIDQAMPVVEMPLQMPPVLVAPPPMAAGHAVPEVQFADIGLEEMPEPRTRRWIWAALLVALAAAVGATAAIRSRQPTATSGTETGARLLNHEATHATAAPESPDKPAKPAEPALVPEPAEDLRQEVSHTRGHEPGVEPRSQSQGHDYRHSRSDFGNPSNGQPRANEAAQANGDAPLPTPTQSRRARNRDNDSANRQGAPSEEILPNPYH
jgi:eukaryotic-like serine/threonine-protein kinase